MRKLYILSMMFILSGLFILMPRLAVAENDPVNLLNSIADQMISNLKAQKATLKTNPTVVYSLAYKILVPHADLEYMSKRVLPAQSWSAATSTQRSAFEKEFTTLLVHTYASALANFTDETVHFYPVRGGYAGRSNIHVESEIIRSQGPSIPVSYSLVSTGSGWKVFDMSVQGVSMLESFRSQFADKLSQGSMDDLISSLKQHNDETSGV